MIQTREGLLRLIRPSPRRKASYSKSVAETSFGRSFLSNFTSRFFSTSVAGSWKACT